MLKIKRLLIVRLLLSLAVLLDKNPTCHGKAVKILRMEDKSLFISRDQNLCISLACFVIPNQLGNVIAESPSFPLTFFLDPVNVGLVKI